MELSDLPKAILVTRPEELKKLAALLEKQSVIAVDTESNSLYAYQEQVCLIQFSAGNVDYLVDPLVLDDMSPLAPLFADPKIEKVFHAAEYDLICLKRDFGFTFENLFDTMVAANVLGREEIGLGSILKKEFGIELDKRFQRADWGQRPLPPQLLAYARLDTHFLIALRDRLKEELKEEGRWPLAAEDFERLRQVSQSAAPAGTERTSEREAIEMCGRIKGAHDLTPQQMAILLELCQYRDGVASSLDRPLFKVMGDTTLIAIATTPPTNLNDLHRLPGMSKGQVYRHGHAILQAIQRGMKAKPVMLPRSPRPDERFLYRLEQLRQWRKDTALAMGVKSDVILPRDLLQELAQHNPQNLDELKEVLSDVPWRLERFGNEILAVIHNHHE